MFLKSTIAWWKNIFYPQKFVCCVCHNDIDRYFKNIIINSAPISSFASTATML